MRCSTYVRTSIDGKTAISPPSYKSSRLYYPRNNGSQSRFIIFVEIFRKVFFAAAVGSYRAESRAKRMLSRVIGALSLFILCALSRSGNTGENFATRHYSIIPRARNVRPHHRNNGYCFLSISFF